jgi:hypothetical protein
VWHNQLLRCGLEPHADEAPRSSTKLLRRQSVSSLHSYKREVEKERVHSYKREVEKERRGKNQSAPPLTSTVA